MKLGNSEAAHQILGVLKRELLDSQSSTEKPYKIKVGKTCNNNCIFCDLLNIKEKYDKSLEEIKKELNKLKDKNYNHITLPCNSDIRKDFFEILEYAKNLGFKITLETNGRVFYYEDFLKKVDDRHCNSCLKQSLIQKIVIYFYLKRG